MRPRVLFILKYRESTWGSYSGTHPASGLLNSARFVRDMLESEGIEAHLVQVVDNNQIDREVTRFHPTHVIIEALWVVSEKFEILTRLHPTVKWIIRNHSQIPFLSNEGIAFKWLLEYVSYPNVSISNNAGRMQEEMRFLVAQAHPHLSREKVDQKVIYLPNYYPIGTARRRRLRDRGDGFIDIGCFGAIRPLKNQMIQAVAAIKFATSVKKRLRFHINGSRVEGNGGPILKNLRETFEKIPQHELVEHGWLDHPEFLELVSQMDIGLQVSFSESFNIVAADFTRMGVPIVGSREIPWMPSFFTADPNDSEDIARILDRAMMNSGMLARFNLTARSLARYSEESKRIWMRYLR